MIGIDRNVGDINRERVRTSRLLHLGTFSRRGKRVANSCTSGGIINFISRHRRALCRVLRRVNGIRYRHFRRQSVVLNGWRICYYPFVVLDNGL